MKRLSVIEEVREIRKHISEKFENDPRKLAAYYRQKQKKHSSRLWQGRQNRGGSFSNLLQKTLPALFYPAKETGIPPASATAGTFRYV
jgi:hypothetical protein